MMRLSVNAVEKARIKDKYNKTRSFFGSYKHIGIAAISTSRAS